MLTKSHKIWFCLKSFNHWNCFSCLHENPTFLNFQHWNELSRKKWDKNGSETRKLPRWTSISNPNSQNFYKTNNKCKKRRLQINGIKMWMGVVARSRSSFKQKFTFKAFKLILLFFEYVAFIRAMPRAVKSNTNLFTRPSVWKANLMPDKCDEMVYRRYL